MITDEAKKAYSDALSELPSQLGISIKHGNDLFDLWKRKMLKQISHKYNIPLNELEEYYRI